LVDLIDFWYLTPLSSTFQLYHGDQFQWWKKPKFPERTTDHGQATGKLKYNPNHMNKAEKPYEQSRKTITGMILVRN
jgi:hypothetical protein